MSPKCYPFFGLVVVALGQAPPAAETQPARMIIEMRPADTHLSDTGSSEENRWFYIEAASISSRFHFVEDAVGATTAQTAQYVFAARGRFKLDGAGRLVVNANVAPGNSFTGGWNNTGVGTARAQSNLFLKQLNLQVRLWEEIDVQYGGLDFARGESSEITSYDFDGYLVGERLRIRRPKQIFFDEASITYGYLGDLNRPNVFPRLQRLNQSNYHQFLVAKNLTRWLRLSADYSSESGVDTLRQALTLRAPSAVRFVDQIRFEQYEQLGRDAGYGFATYGEKKIVGRLSLGSGYAQLDRRGLYSDRFNVGKRLFWNVHFALNSQWSVMVLATQAIAGAVGTAPKTRLDVALGYNLTRRLQPLGRLPR